MDEDQKNYMMNSKLMRNDITYDITANDIGLDKIRLENYATWKTKGTLYTQRYDSQGQRWAANFMVEPMCADAELESFAKFINGTEYHLENDDETTIPITYGANTINLSNYAKEEHVKQIKSELYINDELIDSYEKTEGLNIEKNYDYHFVKMQKEGMAVLNVKVKSYLITQFTTDGALVDVKNYTLVVYFSEQEESGDAEEIKEEEEFPQDDYIEIPTRYNSVRDESYAKFEEFPPPYIDSIELNVINQGDERELPVLRNTGKEFVCAGQTIVIKAVVFNSPTSVTLEFEGDSSIRRFDSITKRFEWDEPKSRRVTTYLPTLEDYKKMYSGIVKMRKNGSVEENATEYIFTYIIPYETKQTLHSWATLRNNSKDAFAIDEKMIFTRKSSPYQIVVKAKSDTGADTKRYDLDVFERWDTIYNRDISKYLVDSFSYWSR